jgi:hypothetical protein
MLGRGSSKTAARCAVHGKMLARLTARSGGSLESERRGLLFVLGCDLFLQLVGEERDSVRLRALIVEVAPFGSLADLADAVDFAEVPPFALRHLLQAEQQAESACAWLAARGRKHGDLRPENALVFRYDSFTLRIKFADMETLSHGRDSADGFVRSVAALFEL